MKHRTYEEKLQLLTEWRQSGKSLRAFCQSQDLCYSTLLRYRKNLSGPPDETKFVPVQVLGGAPFSLEIELPSGIKIRLPETYSPSALKPLLQILQSKC